MPEKRKQKEVNAKRIELVEMHGFTDFLILLHTSTVLSVLKSEIAALYFVFLTIVRNTPITLSTGYMTENFMG